MKQKFIVKSTLVVFALFTAYSCNDLDLHYEGAQTDDEQNAETVAAIPERANAALNGMYALLGTPYVYFGTTSGRADDMGYTSACIGQDMNSGDMTNIVSGYDWFSVALEYTDRTPTYANPQIRNGLFYKVIYATKGVLGLISDDTDNAELKAKRGQAKAMRAFSYLSLAPYFQFKYVGNEDKPSVPLNVEGVNPRNNPRVPLSKLYEVIIQDLTDAIADLNGFVRPNKGLIDKQVAFGLRARAYLYMEEWDKAAADADSALAGYTAYAMNEIRTPGFYNASDHNWIWSILIPTDIAAQELGTWPSQLGSFSGNGYVAYAGIWRSINKLLYEKIPATDVRKNWWLDKDTISPNLAGLTWTDNAKNITYTGQEIVGAVISDVKVAMEPYTNIKFGQRSGIGGAVNDGDWCLMRAEEMILLKAEAEAKAGSLSTGKQQLEDFVKTYRDPAYTSTATTIAEFENEVWLQRRVELWGEGFSMADVMRLGRNVVRYHPSEPTNVPEAYRFNIPANDPWLLLRFVQKETTNNAGVVQNVGGSEPKSGDGSTLLDGLTD